ncbi:hypothetical protein [uncultured Ruegeria sp.]|uniref:hypothetical protein n=1 Tax=uncultured Ruegeria sp. TaxID=259304 RepID=UPI0026136FA2|nr:hypothetical protein [uncultured Ruegeria sp.]
MPSNSDPNLEAFIEAMSKIEKFESQDIVTNWRHRGFHIWPIVKYVIVKQMIFAMNCNFAPSDRFKRYRNFSKRLRLNRNLLGSYKKQPVCSVSVDALPIELSQNHDYWCFGSGSGFCNLNEEKVSQHHHALRVALMEKGHLTLGLYSGFDPKTLPAQSDYGPNASLDSFIKSVTKTARVPKLTQSFLRKHFESLETVIALTGHQEAEICAYADVIVGRLDYTISCFSKLFQTTQPKAIFTSNFASFYGWALAHVSKQYGIRYVDIQHGLEGRFNGSYYFGGTPKQDWSVLPTAHLCWSESDVETFTHQHPERRAAVVGPTWDQFAKFMPKLIESTGKALSAHQDRARPLVLFAGQQVDDILVAKQLNDAGLNILFRSHPLRKEETELLVDSSELEALGCELAFETPLPTLLEEVDGVVTGYSAVILEACLKGVSVLATGSYASLLEQDYAREINGLLTVRSRLEGDGMISEILAWSHAIDCKKPHYAQSTSSYADALSAVDVAL